MNIDDPNFDKPPTEEERARMLKWYDETFVAPRLRAMVIIMPPMRFRDDVPTEEEK